jgi:pimeloyl-ACP methyl ester carboxylesterase
MPDYLEPELRSTAIDGKTRAWREHGGGDPLPLVCLHGIGSNSRAWAGQFAHARGRRMIAWNAPGYAGSDALPAEAPAPQDYAAALAGLLDRLGIDRFVLVGQSLGAIIAAAFALEHPGRVAALALASPASGYGVPAGAPLPANVEERVQAAQLHGAQGLADRRAHRLLTANAGEQARAIVHGAMAEVDPAGYAQASRMLAHADLPRMVAGLAMPTLVLWGGEDIITVPASCRAVAQAVPGGEALEIPGVGHGFATEAPALFNAAIEDWLSRRGLKEG